MITEAGWKKHNLRFGLFLDETEHRVKSTRNPRRNVCACTACARREAYGGGQQLVLMPEMNEF